MRLTDRELATVLDALRWWQNQRIETGAVYQESYFSDHTPLEVSAKGDDEVDQLCERLNTGEEEEVNGLRVYRSEGEYQRGAAAAEEGEEE